MKRTLFLAALLAALAVSPAMAHKGHAAPSPSPATAVEAPASTLAAEEAEDAPAAGSPTEDSGDLTEQGVMAAIPWNEALTGHVHNKIVHFPLALGLAAAVILLISPRWPAYAPAARGLLIAGALAAVVAYFSGEAQHEPFEDSPFRSVMELHETMGIATGITLWAGVALTFLAGARRFLPLYGIFLAFLLVVTGFLGGVLSHS